LPLEVFACVFTLRYIFSKLGKYCILINGYQFEELVLLSKVKIQFFNLKLTAKLFFCCELLLRYGTTTSSTTTTTTTTSTAAKSTFMSGGGENNYSLELIHNSSKGNLTELKKIKKFVEYLIYKRQWFSTFF
jgi:hypothetical protein